VTCCVFALAHSCRRADNPPVARAKRLPRLLLSSGFLDLCPCSDVSGEQRCGKAGDFYKGSIFPCRPLGLSGGVLGSRRPGGGLFLGSWGVVLVGVSVGWWWREWCGGLRSLLASYLYLCLFVFYLEVGWALPDGWLKTSSFVLLLVACRVRCRAPSSLWIDAYLVEVRPTLRTACRRS